MKGSEIQEKEEKNCVKRFLSYYCQENNEREKDAKIKPNEIQDVVDVFVNFKNGKKLKIQVTVADYIKTGCFQTQISKKYYESTPLNTRNESIPFSIRDRHDMRPVLKALNAKIEKYKKQGKDEKEMNNIFLLFDDQMGDFPIDATKDIGWSSCKNYFKEVWYVGRTRCIYRIL